MDDIWPHLGSAPSLPSIMPLCPKAYSLVQQEAKIPSIPSLHYIIYEQPLMGALIQGQWYVYILSLLTIKPKEKRYMHVPRSVQRYVHVPEQTYLIYKLIQFRGCLEDASERTNVPLSSAHTWTPFHPSEYLHSFFVSHLINLLLAIA